MPEIGLTDFVDFALKAGPTQLTKVRELKMRPDYDPARDYWKRLRDWIIAHTAGELTMKELQARVSWYSPVSKVTISKLWMATRSSLEERQSARHVGPRVTAGRKVS